MHNLKTERLILRPWMEEDLEALFKYASHPEVGPICGWTPHKDIEESRWVLKNILMVPKTYAMVLQETGEAIGSISLMFGDRGNLPLTDGTCELGYWLAYPYWGRGLTTEAAQALIGYAFDHLQCIGVWCCHMEGNHRSRRVMEKCGFQHDHSVEKVYRPSLGEERTSHRFYLSRENWKK